MANSEPSPNVVARAHAYARNVSGSLLVDLGSLNAEEHRSVVESCIERAFVIGYAAGYETASDPRRRR